MKIINTTDLNSRIDTLYEHGNESGLSLGWGALDENMTLKTGTTFYVYGQPASGKCLGKGTKIIMADATLKSVEDIVVGDKIMGDDGSHRTVLSTCTGNENLYLIKQHHGMDYVVNESHILTLRKSKQGKKDKKCLKGHIIDISVKDALTKSDNFFRTYKGFKAASYFDEQPTMVEPYFLGVWLGDGRSAGGDITTPDAEIVEYLSGYAERLGMRFSKYQSGDKCPSYGIVGNGNGLQGILNKMGLQRNKHIPYEFICNSEKNRLDLLAGLIDTDGYASKGGHYSICQKSEVLINQIKHLANTLGFRTSITNIRKKCQNNFIGDYFNLSIGGDINRNSV